MKPALNMNANWCYTHVTVRYRNEPHKGEYQLLEKKILLVIRPLHFLNWLPRTHCCYRMVPRNRRWRRYSMSCRCGSYIPLPVPLWPGLGPSFQFGSLIQCLGRSLAFSPQKSFVPVIFSITRSKQDGLVEWGLLGGIENSLPPTAFTVVMLHTVNLEPHGQKREKKFRKPEAFHGAFNV